MHSFFFKLFWAVVVVAAVSGLPPPKCRPRVGTRYSFCKYVVSQLQFVETDRLASCCWKPYVTRSLVILKKVTIGFFGIGFIVL